MAIATIDPASGRELQRFEEHTNAQVEAVLEDAARAQASWRTRSFGERAALMVRAAEHLERHAEEHARNITVEMGKTIGEARAEVGKCAWNCRFYAEHAARFLAPEPVATNASESYVEFPPLGVVLAIMPWNFPYWQLFRFAAPALMAGNTVVLKHASNVPRSALAIERVFTESGFPDGVFRSILISGARAETLIDDPRIAAVTLTGSEAVGERVGARAGHFPFAFVDGVCGCLVHSLCVRDVHRAAWLLQRWIITTCLSRANFKGMTMHQESGPALRASRKKLRWLFSVHGACGGANDAKTVQW